MKKILLVSLVAVGWLVQNASAQTSLFTTTNDFSGWSSQNGDTVGSSTLWDSDGGVVNGLGNSNPGSSGTAGSLSINLNGWTGGNYNSVSFGPDRSYSSTFLSAIDPGSTPVTYPPPNYNQVPGTTVAYSGQFSMVYTLPDNNGGNYFQIGLVLNYNSDYSVGFGTVTSLGTVDGQTTYEATIPYTIKAGSLTYFQFGLLYNGNYAPTTPFYVDDISVAPVPEPATVALAAVGGAALLFFRRRAMR